jgi:hypothetical protein
MFKINTYWNIIYVFFPPNFLEFYPFCIYMYISRITYCIYYVAGSSVSSHLSGNVDDDDRLTKLDKLHLHLSTKFIHCRCWREKREHLSSTLWWNTGIQQLLTTQKVGNTRRQRLLLPAFQLILRTMHQSISLSL